MKEEILLTYLMSDHLSHDQAENGGLEGQQ